MVFRQSESTDVLPIVRQICKSSSILDGDKNVVFHDLFVRALLASSKQKISCHSDCRGKVLQLLVQTLEQPLAPLRLVFDAPSHRGHGLQHVSSCLKQLQMSFHRLSTCRVSIRCGFSCAQRGGWVG